MDGYAPRGRRPPPIDLLMLLTSFAVVGVGRDPALKSAVR
jgi:hypothetical protein